MSIQRSCFVGVDWATQTHHVFVLDANGHKLGERGFRHGGAGLGKMTCWIQSLSGGMPTDAVHAAIEVPHGPVLESLMDRGFRVFAIIPKQLDRFRDRFSPASAKDDNRDAHRQIGRLTEKLAEQRDMESGQYKMQRDVTTLAFLPGVGKIVLATLLAEASDALQRRDYHALRCLSGVAPVTKRS